MLRRALLILLGVQVLDLFLLVWLGRNVGFLQTLLMLGVMGALGGALARHEGLRVWRGWSRAVELGHAPEEGVVSGMLVLLAAVLLVAPGFVTDALASFLLVPVIRRALARYLGRRLRGHELQGAVLHGFRGPERWQGTPPFGGRRAHGTDDGRVIDTTGVEQGVDARSERVSRALPD